MWGDVEVVIGVRGAVRQEFRIRLVVLIDLALEE
jgi:hypothetical protein